MHVVAAKAICFAEAMTDQYKAYGQAVVDNARALAETLMAAGLPLASGGTDNHLMLVDVTTVGLGGKKAEAVLGECGITVNMNMIPFDKRKPMDPIGHPHRHTRADDTWDGHRRNEKNWGLDPSGVVKSRRRRSCTLRSGRKSANWQTTFPFPPEQKP